jgi:hypothetical protein
MLHYIVIMFKCCNYKYAIIFYCVIKQSSLTLRPSKVPRVLCKTFFLDDDVVSCRDPFFWLDTKIIKIFFPLHSLAQVNDIYHLSTTKKWNVLKWHKEMGIGVQFNNSCKIIAHGKLRQNTRLLSVTGPKDGSILLSTFDACSL